MLTKAPSRDKFKAFPFSLVSSNKRQSAIPLRVFHTLSFHRRTKLHNTQTAIYVKAANATAAAPPSTGGAMVRCAVARVEKKRALW